MVGLTFGTSFLFGQEAPKPIDTSAAGVVAKADPDTNYGVVAAFVTKLLQHQHFDHKRFDGETVLKAVENYIDDMDPQKLYFTQSEVDTWKAKFGTSLDDFILDTDLTPAIEIYVTYRKKVVERFGKIQAFVKAGKFDLASAKSVSVNRKDLPYAASQEQLDQLWEDRLTSDILEQRLNKVLTDERKVEKEAKKKEKEKEKEKEKLTDANPEKPAEATPEPPKPEAAPVKPEKTPEEKVLSRYERLLRLIMENDEEDVTSMILSAIAKTYDPHTDYMSAPEDDKFRVEMGKSLIGIGAQLQMDEDDNLPTIDKLVRGGPAALGGQLKPGDKVLAVGQGPTGELEETEGYKLDRVVQKIRGPVDTVVRLKVMPAADPSTTKEILITRKVVPMNETKAKAQLVEVTKEDGKKERHGWIIIDSFYGDPNNKNGGTTADVQVLLNRLMKENIEGLVVDLRGNGGGYLEEALALTGLFIERGPVVQVKSFDGKSTARGTKGDAPKYDGPLVVMTDRLSASASEIFAAAMQDYGRAVVAGDSSSFGKGTVQTVVELEDVLPPKFRYPRAGSLKVTIQKFYRVAGGSTQEKGVVPDVVFPSRFEGLEIGENTYEGFMKHDETTVASYKPARQGPMPVSELAKRSSERVAASKEFAYIKEDVAQMKKQTAENSLSLNLESRLAESRERKGKFEERKKERRNLIEDLKKKGDPYTVYEINVENVVQPELVKVEDAKKEKFMIGADTEEEEEEVVEDFMHDLEPAKLEGLAVLQDLINIQKNAKTAQVSPPAPGKAAP